MTTTSWPPVAPRWMRAFWRGFIFLGLAAFFTVSAMAMRGLVGGFGLLEFWPMVVAAIATLITGLLVAPIASLVDLPEAIYSHWLPERRVGRGGCAKCGYSALHAPATECPECGALLENKPTPYRTSWKTLRKVIALTLPAWVVGSALGFTIMVLDEYSFAVESTNHRRQNPDSVQFMRPRAGVAGFAYLQWTPEEGCTGPKPYDSPKERNWKPKPSN